jgi:heme-degrading monooxygenase HmoA
MGDTYASGDWRVRAGEEDEFVSRWNAFLEWTRDSADGFQGATLIRQNDDGSHFISFSEWADDAARDAWNSSPEFPQKLGACRELCDEFVSKPFTRAASIKP